MKTLSGTMLLPRLTAAGLVLVSLFVAALVLAPVWPPAPGSPGSVASASDSTPSPAPLRTVTLGMGYIPNVQFAPFYVADAKGYFAEEGLKLDFKYGMEDDLLKLIGTGRLQFAIGSGDQVILARSQGLPAIYVANFYRKYPVNVMSLKEKNIRTAKDLEGKTVGTPCLCGASYVGWQALAYAAGIDPQKVNLQVIGYTQPAMVERGRVDAALDYVVNGPVQLRLAGKEVNEIFVSDFINLISNGIITNDETVESEPDLVRGLVRGFLRGLRDTLANPQEALDITLKYVPEAGGTNRAVTEAVLKASIDLWQGDPLGVTERQDWLDSQSFMKKVNLIGQETDVDRLFSNQFVVDEAS